MWSVLNLTHVSNVDMFVEKDVYPDWHVIVICILYFKFSHVQSNKKYTGVDGLLAGYLQSHNAGLNTKHLKTAATHPLSILFFPQVLSLFIEPANNK